MAAAISIGGKKEKGMKNIVLFPVVFCVVLLGSGSAFAGESPGETVAKGCDKEFTTYCKDVTPGEGRGLACLYAHNDKLSPKCEYALYDAAAQLQRALTVLTYVANECRTELVNFCSDIKPGEGRLLQCLDKNAAKVSPRCTAALKDTGLKK
jgi:hypothetical protein